MLQTEPTGDTGIWRRALIAPLLLAGLVWFSHFFWSGKFGLYEDDYTCVEPQMNAWKFRELRANIYEAFAQFIQGRPFLYVFGHTLAYVSTRPGGSLATAYLVAFGVQILNAWLVLLVARRAIGPRFAPVAAVVFALAPADTTQPFLHVCFCVQPSVTMMLLFLLAYQKGWRVLSYPLAALTLLTYETCFLPLLAAPFLGAEGPRLRRVISHGAVLGVILAVALGFRAHRGEARTKEEFRDKSVAAKKVFRLATTGPATSLGAFATKPAELVHRVCDPGYFRADGLRPLAALWAVTAATLCATLLIATGAVSKGDAVRGQLVRVALAGVAMVALSYPAALNRNPTHTEGRMSSVHIAAAPGWGLVAGAGLALVLPALPRSGRRALWVAVAAYFGVLAAYHVSVQRDYVRGWAEQRRFWAEIVRLCPDLDDGTVILYPYPRQEYPAVAVNSWADSMLVPRMFAKVPPWKQPPVAAHVGYHQVVPFDYSGYDWSKEAGVENGEPVLLHWTGQKLPLRTGTVIAVYPDETGRYHRVTGALEINGVRVPLRDPAPNPNLVPTPLRWQLTLLP
jgi:hypothetical protein